MSSRVQDESAVRIRTGLIVHSLAQQRSLLQAVALVQEVTGGIEMPAFASWPGKDDIYRDDKYPHFPPCAKDNERQPYFSKYFSVLSQPNNFSQARRAVVLWRRLTERIALRFLCQLQHSALSIQL